MNATHIHSYFGPIKLLEPWTKTRDWTGEKCTAANAKLLDDKWSGKKAVVKERQCQEIFGPPHYRIITVNEIEVLVDWE